MIEVSDGAPGGDSLGREGLFDVRRVSVESFPGAYDQIAGLHIASIHHGLLPDLGHRFLSRLYREIDTAPTGEVWASVEAKRVVGFVAGCSDTKRCYYTVLRSAGLSLVQAAGGSLFSPNVLRRLPSVARYPFRNGGAGIFQHRATPAELLAIAVDPATRGRGIGTRLVRALEAGLRSRGVAAYRVATNAADPHSNRFYLRAGFVPRYTIENAGLTLQVYSKELVANR